MWLMYIGLHIWPIAITTPGVIADSVGMVHIVLYFGQIAAYRPI